MAAARKKIGMLLYDQKEWTGGFYYILNLIRSLQFLPDAEKPQLIFFYGGNEADVPEDIQAIQYPYVSYLPMYVKIGTCKRIVNKFMRMLGSERMLGTYDFDTVEFIYPCLDFSLNGTFSFLKNLKKIYWIPDFQDKYYPHFFSKTELENREHLKQQFIEKRVPLVFSSYNAGEDFKTFYPQAENRIKVLRFTSILPAMQDLAIEDVFKKYAVSGPYFISPNQFWAHKNHTVVIDAVKILAQQGIQVQLFFTGKEFNTQAPEYAIGLKKKVHEMHLEKNIHFLGFIDRTEQLLLMREATAVLQPSLFEGWSTVVEDTKAVGGKLIVSDLPIHREQCTENTTFFDPHDARELADKIAAELQHPSIKERISYEQQIRAFAHDFIQLNN